jgi:hypothetical protein
MSDYQTSSTKVVSDICETIFFCFVSLLIFKSCGRTELITKELELAKITAAQSIEVNVETD